MESGTEKNYSHGSVVSTHICIHFHQVHLHTHTNEHTYEKWKWENCQGRGNARTLNICVLQTLWFYLCFNILNYMLSLGWGSEKNGSYLKVEATISGFPSVCKLHHIKHLSVSRLKLQCTVLRHFTCRNVCLSVWWKRLPSSNTQY